MSTQDPPGFIADPLADQLDVRAQLSEAHLLVLGGTGFLGKVWLSMLLHHYPEVGHVHLMVRARRNSAGEITQTSEARFWSEIAPSAVFDPIRERFPGAAFDAFMKERISVVDGDVTRPFAGVSEVDRDRIRGTLTALVNASGVVDFNPPLDYALNVNAFGMQNLVDLARDLDGPDGLGVPFLHTSTAYVAGGRTGQVEEVDPRAHPFPRAGELDRSHWDPEREISECVDLVENVRHRANDAFRQSDFLDQAKRNLTARSEPTRGTALAGELERVKRRFEENQLVEWGTERAQFWGWHNIYTYTKSLGEQILARSGVPFSIARPAVIESALRYPRPGWTEGINTSAPLIYLALKGPIVFPRESDTVLDIIPVDQVAAGMILSLTELIEGQARPVYHYGTSDTQPLSIDRLIELVGLFRRQHYLNHAGGNPLLNWVNARIEPESRTADRYYEIGPRYRSEKVGAAAKWLGRFAEGPLEPLVGPAAANLQKLSKGLEIQARIIDQFVPFMATHNYRFSCNHVREAYSRLEADEQRLLDWSPERIDWRHYIMEVHGPGVRTHVNPQIDEKIAKERKPLKTYDNLLQLLDEVAERHDLAPALLRTHPDGLTRVSYRDLRLRSIAAGARLQRQGLQRGDRVLLAAANHPDWVISYFGILRAGGVAVPLDPALEPGVVETIIAASGAKRAVLDEATEARFDLDIPVDSLHALTEPNADATLVVSEPAELASILYTSGTTGSPKGVMLSHENFCALVASVSGVFTLRPDDRLLSVLPLHHAFEFGCGLLMPLSMGSRIIYLDRVDGDRLAHGLVEGRVTCMVGVPALWQLLDRRIRAQVSGRGQLFSLAFDAGIELNRKLGKQTGLDLGKLMFGSIHARFGGNIRLLISGGSALPTDTQTLFQGLGLHLSEGYGLTEASPVLTVSEARPGSKTGHVGKAIPGVELKINGPDDQGIGEVWARGNNVMQGYFGDRKASEQTVDADGWLHTGDLGRLDHKGRLYLVGRAKEVVVTAAGENIYLDDVENTLGEIASVEEYSLVGLVDPRGGERLGMLARPEPGQDADGVRRAIRAATDALPAVQRPAVIHLVDAPLPRTSTRKVQRKSVAATLEKIVAATPKQGRGEGVAGPVARAIGAVAGVESDTVGLATDLREAFGFDSLMWVELASALEGLGQHGVTAERLAECQTVADVVALVDAPPVPLLEDKRPAGSPVEVPAVIAKRLKAGLTKMQHTLNGAILQTRVLGRAHIPANRTAIVVSNHTSHLDMGLVKYALGPYGKNMTALAAKDYFFEGNRWKVAYFEHLTNVTPLDRRSGFRTSLRQAEAAVDSGRIVLLFPEGTRQTSGELGEFKALVGKLALQCGVDILPMHIDGAYEALPKGSGWLKSRQITVRIGPPLGIEHLRRLTEGAKPADAARQVTGFARTAVERLGTGGVFNLSDVKAEEAESIAQSKTLSAVEQVDRAFEGLAKRFDTERVDHAVSWYFSLGETKWTVTVSDDGCSVSRGRPSGGQADCVIKSSPDLIKRLIEDAYVPGPSEFVSGAIKTNDIPLLIEFSRVFDLNEYQA